MTTASPPVENTATPRSRGASAGLRPPRRAGDIDAIAGFSVLAADSDKPSARPSPASATHGYSWADIGTRLGVTRQAAQQRWEAPGHDRPQHRAQVRRAHHLDPVHAPPTPATTAGNAPAGSGHLPPAGTPSGSAPTRPNPASPSPSRSTARCAQQAHTPRRSPTTTTSRRTRHDHQRRGRRHRPRTRTRPGAGGNSRRRDHHLGGFSSWERQLARTGACSRPVRLRGVSAIDLASGEAVARTACCTSRAGTAAKPRCPACSALYKGDARQLVRAGLTGGKGVPESVAAHPCVFATLTAPSFGPVHARRMRGKTVLPCRPRRDATRPALPARPRHLLPGPPRRR